VTTIDNVTNRDRLAGLEVVSVTAAANTTTTPRDVLQMELVVRTAWTVKATHTPTTMSTAQEENVLMSLDLLQA